MGGDPGGVDTTPDDVDVDQLRVAFVAEHHGRLRAEALAAERDETIARLQAELRDLGRLRDNFHSLYKEERQLRAEAEQVAEQSRDERDLMEREVVRLASEVDRLERHIVRLQRPDAADISHVAAPAAATAPAPPAELIAAVDALTAELASIRAERDALLAGQAVVDGYREAAERAELSLQAANASLAVLEQRLRDVDEARQDAEGRAAAAEDELADLRTSVLTGRAESGTRRSFLRRRASVEPAPAVSTPAPAATGASVGASSAAPSLPAPAGAPSSQPQELPPAAHGRAIELSGVPEDVEEALNRRLFGGS
jgi:hypothetical protein